MAYVPNPLLAYLLACRISTSKSRQDRPDAPQVWPDPTPKKGTSPSRPITRGSPLLTSDKHPRHGPHNLVNTPSQALDKVMLLQDAFRDRPTKIGNWPGTSYLIHSVNNRISFRFTSCQMEDVIEPDLELGKSYHGGEKNKTAQGRVVSDIRSLIYLQQTLL